MTVYLFHVVEEKTQKSLFFCKFEETFKEQSFWIHWYIVRASQKLKTKGRTIIVACNRLQENFVKTVSCQFCHADVTLLENVSTSSRLGSSWIVSCEN